MAGLGLGVGVLAACYTTNFSHRPDSAWLQYHTLTAAWAAAGLIVLGLALLGRKLRLAAEDDGQSILPKFETAAGGTGRFIFPSSLVQNWVTAIGCLVLLLAVIHSHADPESPWWSSRAIVAVSVMAGVLALWLRQPAYVFISGLLLCAIGTIAWMAWPEPAWRLPAVASLVQANVLCLAVGSAVWSVLRLILPAGVPDAQFDRRRLAFSHLAARCAVGLLAVVVAVAVGTRALGLQQILVIQRLDWIALAAAAVAVTICVWDRSSRFALPGLYALGLSALGMGLCARGLTSHELCHAAAIELAAFVLATAALGAVLPKLNEAWQALRIPVAHWRDASATFPAAQTAVAGTVAALSLWISLDLAFDRITDQAFAWPLGRMIGPLAVALLLPAAVLLAADGKDRWRERWQHATLGLGIVVVSEIGFVWLVPDQAPWLHRSVILMVAAVVMTLVAGLGLRQLLPETSDWITSGRRLTPLLGGLALLTLAVVLVQEGLLFDLENGTPMAWPAMVVVAVALGALLAGCLTFAVRPDWDPLGLDERQRQLYVYGAEVLGCLIGLHIWFCMPWLFTRGLVRQFWMLIVMCVAFVGVGLSELFHRRKMPVLSEPLRRTALLLPLAPAIGYWFMKATTGQTGFLGHASPAMWLLMGLFYGFMAVNKRSIWLAGLAALAGTTGLWTLLLLPQIDIHIYEHPQLWLIPVALAALVAEYLNHDRLDKAQGASVRYLALSVIYVSSTADMFIAGIGESFLMPVILMLLSVLGAMTGILLRVRSFLYLGVAFLVLDVVSMVAYAAIHQQTRWIAYVCGMALGVAVLILVGIFEKLRNDILAAVERFKDWEG
jgi:hypothetical protein